jgi:putative membrane protein
VTATYRDRPNTKEVTAMQTLIPLGVYASSSHDGHWWVVFPIFWAALIATAIFLLWRRGRRGPDDPAKRILGERFARGEISADEYRERLAQLQ